MKGESVRVETSIVGGSSDLARVAVEQGGEFLEARTRNNRFEDALDAVRKRWRIHLGLLDMKVCTPPD